MNQPARLIVFSGPTLSAEQGRALIDAEFLPPARRGDVYRAALDQPVAIGLIDGYFDQVDAVTHKEILWAMAHGVHVVGSASMGALRAAELATFGMSGIGEVFHAYARGELEDDDEVALAHGSAEDDHRPLSVAMVDIRATLGAARDQGVLSQNSTATLLSAAKALFYTERCFPVILDQARARGMIAESELNALAEFLPTGRVEQKRLDALAMLAFMSEQWATGTPEPKRVGYHFAHTDAWDAIRRQVDADRDKR